MIINLKAGTDRHWLKTTYLHLLFWLSFWIISAFAYPKFQDGRFNYLESFTYQFFYLFGKILLTYWTLFVLFPKLFVTKKYWTFGLLFFLSLVAASLLQRAINLYIYYQYIYSHYFHTTAEPINYTFWVRTPIIQTILVTYPPAVVALCAKAIYEWYKGQSRLKEAEKEQLYSELRFLQAQIHPHFFLNTTSHTPWPSRKPRCSNLVKGRCAGRGA